MEFDIGNIIYIIVTIAVVLMGVLNKKKPGNKSAPSKEGSSSPGLLERLERELSGLVNDTKETVQTVSEEFLPGSSAKAESDNDRVEYESISQKDLLTQSDSGILQQYEGVFDRDFPDSRDLLNSDANRISEHDQILDIIDLDNVQEHADYYEIVKEFDLGTAVIYSTIINRKEY